MQNANEKKTMENRRFKMGYTRESERRILFYLTLFMLGMGVVSKWI